MSVSCRLEVICGERADLLALLYVMFFVFVFFFSLSHAVSRVQYLIVSILDLCLLPYFTHAMLI